MRYILRPLQSVQHAPCAIGSLSNEYDSFPFAPPYFMRHYPRADLTAPIEESLRDGHPWIFADAIRCPSAKAGDVVDVYDTSGDWLGRGILDPDSPIQVRLWTLNQHVDVDDQLLEQRIRAAFKRRPFPTADTTGFRLLHGESDRLPGLVCDVYDRVAVLRPDGTAAERWIDSARRIIDRLLDIDHWVLRRARKYAGNNPESHWWDDAPDGPVQFLERGLLFEVDPIAGQKTGFFLDQRANRRRIADLSSGKRLLNLFGYTGAFSVAAAAAGAAITTTVDLAKPALEMARKNFELNDIPAAAHHFEASDVFDYLDQFSARSAPFEVAVCDPPSFAHRRSDLEQASATYVDLFTKLLTIMPNGSTVALASCSSHVDRRRFVEIITAASRQARTQLVLAGCWGADIDHPWPVGFPQGDYLQFAMGTISRD